MIDPSKHNSLSEKQRNEICAVLGMGCGRATAAKRVGCSEADLWHEAEANPDFLLEMRQAESAYELRHMKNVYEAGNDPANWRVSVWALEHVLPERYARRDPGRMNVDQMAMFVGRLANILVEEVPDESIRENMQRRMQELISELKRGRIRKGASANE